MRHRNEGIMTAALAVIAVTGAGQVAVAALKVTLWLLAAAILAASVTAAVRSWKRAAAFLRSEQEPPAHEDTQPVGEIGDDTLAMIRAARREEAAERKAAASDLEPYAAHTVADAIEHMEREWNRKQGDR
jgi:hypothetical protein